MIFNNTKLINLWETAVSFFLFVLLVVSFSSPRGGDSLIALRFGTYAFISTLKIKWRRKRRY